MGAMLLEVHSKDVSEKIIEQELEDTIWIGISDYEQTRYSWRAASTPDTEISYKNFLNMFSYKTAIKLPIFDKNP